MKKQKIKVNTKGGLLAAFECAKGYYGPTVIKLFNHTYTLSPAYIYSKEEWKMLAQHPYPVIYMNGDYHCRHCGEVGSKLQAIACCLDKEPINRKVDWADYIKNISKAKSKIRRIPAKELLF